MNTLDCIEKILKKTGEAMSVAELLPLMRESGEWTCNTSTPENSVRTQLNTDILRKGKESRFCRPERGRFALRPTEPDALGYFYIFVNMSFSSRWVKVLTSYKPISPDGAEINDPAVPLPYRVFSAYKTHRFASARTALFGLLITEERDAGDEPHEGFFHVSAPRAHQMMVSVAESFGERDGVYVAGVKSKKPVARVPHPPPVDGSTEVYVGNLNYDTTEDELKAAFSKYGTVVSVQMPRNHYTGKSKGFGFVGMRDRAEAEKACEALRGKEIGGRPIKTNITQNAAPETVLG